MAIAGQPECFHTIRVAQPLANFNRLQFVVHFAAILALIYYRVSTLLTGRVVARIPWFLLSIAELILAFLWILSQAFRWRPVERTVFPERLPEDSSLPPIDVFVCTADPEKEPTMEVMNTLVSTMCLDYPSEKLHVYLSDDGGSQLTLCATKLAYRFARSWLPFCRRYQIETRCPEAYFSITKRVQSGSNSHSGNEERSCREEGNDTFLEERKAIQLLYEDLRSNVEKAKETFRETQTSAKNGGHRLSHIEIIKEEQDIRTWSDEEKMPLLVYVSREKRSGFAHHFKAGALNVLLRVSSTISNSPFILVLDCDMYMNNLDSARQAMCFHLDPNLAPSLAFVQFPQCFNNVSKNDIYSAELRNFFKILWKGCDGLKGPILSGTGFYIKRNALYGAKPDLTSLKELCSAGNSELKKAFGNSNEFIASLRQSSGNKYTTTSASEVTQMASCTYEIDTLWGEQIGFLYGSVVEDYYTGFHLHCRGWVSAYCHPSRPAFLGSVPISFHDTLVQNKRWMSGLLQVGFSKFCPLSYGLSSRTSVLQMMCYAWCAFVPLYSVPLLLYGTIPQLCFFKGIPLFPPLSSPWFALFGLVHVSSMCQHLTEVLRCGGSLTMWFNELRFWLIISVTAYLFSCLNMVMKLLGLGEVNFDLTNKTVGKEQVRMYENGVFDFEGTSLMLVPLITLTLLNVTTFFGGVWRLIFIGYIDEMFGQFVLSVAVLIISYPVLEGIMIRIDKGRVPSFITLWSVILATLLQFILR